MLTIDILNTIFEIFLKLPSFPVITKQLLEAEDLETFEEQEDTENPNMYKSLPPFVFIYIGFDDQKEYSQLSPSYKLNYESMHSIILYPNSTVQEVVAYMKMITFDNGVNLYNDSFEKTINAVGKQKEENIDYLIILFGFIHEIGHYEHFVSVDKKPSRYDDINNIENGRVAVEKYADEFAQHWLRIFIKEQMV